jgi:hypothetical protein
VPVNSDKVEQLGQDNPDQQIGLLAGKARYQALPKPWQGEYRPLG